MQFKTVIGMDALKSILNPILALDTEAILSVSDKGISANVVDPAKCAMLQIQAGAGVFDYIKTDGEGEIAIDVAQLANLLIGNDPVTLEIDDQKLLVATGKMEYNIRLIDPATIRKPPRIPQLDFAACVDIPAKELSDALKGALRVAGKKDDIVVSQDDEYFLMVSTSPGAAFRARWPIGEVRVRDGESRAVMAMDYMSAISNVFTGTVRIESSIDAPLIMTAKNGEVSTVFMLAPRLEQDN